MVENNFLYPRLRYSGDMAFCIWEFINLIGTHKAELKDPRNTGLMNFQAFFYNNKKFNPGGVLKDYIYLEGNSFFQYAKHLKENKEDKNMPELPHYLDKLRDFRNCMIAHRDNWENHEFPKEWQKLQEDMHQLISAEQLVKDIDIYYKDVLRRQKDSMKFGNSLRRD